MKGDKKSTLFVGDVALSVLLRYYIIIIYYYECKHVNEMTRKRQ